MTTASKPYVKYTTEELMEVVDVFGVSGKGLADIRAVLEREPKVPDAGNFFRYYNPRSKVAAFEEQVALKTGSRHVLAVNSGTSALVAAMVAAGIGPGTEVIVPGYTFFASASAVVVAKGIPVIVEIDETLTLDPVAVEKAITPQTKAILPVHMLGLPCKMDELKAIAKKHNLVVIEDAAQAFGGKYTGQYLGAVGDIGCVSLDAYKVIGTGEGGLVLTNDEWMYTKAQSYHDAAACWRPDRYERERKPGELFCGENYRMPELCAAVGIAQLRKLDWITGRNRSLWNQIRSETKLPSFVKWVESNDPDGVCGHRLGMLFETRDYLTKAGQAGLGLGSLATGETGGVRDWHVYWNWEHILEQKTATPEGCPFKCQHTGTLPVYSQEMCPRTRDIMLRFAVINLNPGMTSEDASGIARKLSTGLAKLS